MNKTVIIIIAVVIVAAALLRRVSLAAGHWLTVAVLVYYLAVNFRFFTANIGRFRSAPAKTKVRVVVYAAMACIAVHGLLTVTGNYFAVIVLLAIDYLIDEE